MIEMISRWLSASSALFLSVSVISSVGCQPPRFKSLEAYESATKTNPPRDTAAAPVDPYSYGGMASGSGGRNTKTTNGAGSSGKHAGAGEIYGLDRAKGAETKEIHLVPEPNGDVTAPHLGSPYIGAKDEGAPATGAPKAGGH